MKKILALLLSPLFALNALACMNEISVIPGITYPNQLNGWELWKPDIDKASLYAYIDRSEKNCGDDLICSDLVIAYLYAGKAQQALELSTRLINKYPQRYEVVMTHAAALELNGRLKEALAYVRKGLRIDPHSHKDSEWIHVKILEARIAGGTPNTILGLDFGNGNEPDTPKGVANVRKLVDQVHFQLSERYYFIPQNDPQFGALLHDYANALYLANFKTVSREYYDLAIAYGFDRTITPNAASLPPLPRKEPELQPWQKRKVADNAAAEPAKPHLSGEIKVPLIFAAVIVLTALAHGWITHDRRRQT